MVLFRADVSGIKGLTQLLETGVLKPRFEFFFKATMDCGVLKTVCRMFALKDSSGENKRKSLPSSIITVLFILIEHLNPQPCWLWQSNRQVAGEILLS